MLIKEIQAICEEVSAAKAKAALDDTVKALVNEGMKLSVQTDNMVLSQRIRHVILLAACIALANKEKTEQAMRKITKTLNAEEVGNIIKLMAVYCGFPAAMDGFAALRACEVYTN